MIGSDGHVQLSDADGDEVNARTTRDAGFFK
jgi:hypothetical protein